MAEDLEKKTIFQKWWFWVIVVVALFIIIGFGSSSEFQEGLQEGYNSSISNQINSKEDNAIVNNITSTEEKYTNKLEWTNNGSDDYNQQLQLAVEVESYAGEILQSGKYKVTQTNNVHNKINERIYNIYVSDKKYDKFEDIPLTDLVGSVGGVQNENEIEIDLQKGQYIVISLVSGGEDGHLKMEKLNK